MTSGKEGKGPSFGGRTVPNMGAGSSYLQTVRDALEGKRGEVVKGNGKERGKEAEAVQRKGSEES